MSTHQEIFNSLSDAIAAFNREPGLLEEIKKLKDEVALYREVEHELGHKINTMTEVIETQTDRIAKYQSEIQCLTGDVDRLRDVVASLEATLRHEGHRNAELSVEIEQKDILINILRSDKAALERQLNDKSTMFDRASATLKRIMGEAAGVVEGDVTPEVVAPAPFSVSVEPSLGADPAAADAIDETLKECAAENTSGPAPADVLAVKIKAEDEYRWF